MRPENKDELFAGANKGVHHWDGYHMVTANADSSEKNERRNDNIFGYMLTDNAHSNNQA